MNGRTLARVLLVIILVAGAIGLGVTAYNAGVSAGLAANGNVTINPAIPGAVGPYVGYGYGYGWFGHGFGLFGFLGTLFFIFILFALIRAAFGAGRGWGRYGGYGRWGGPARWADPDHDHGDQLRNDPWTARVREVHDELHREGGAPGDASGGSAGRPGGTTAG
jgi:hypothetical protein